MSTSANPTTGDLARMPLPEVLADLHGSRASGLLYLVRGSATRVVELASGVPRWVHAESNESFASFLLRRGFTDLASYRRGALPEGHDARSLAHEHAFDILCDSFSWPDGVFVFAAGAALPDAGSLGCSLAAVLAAGLPRFGRIDMLVVRAGHGRVEAVPDAPLDALADLPDHATRVMAAVRAATTARAAGTESWPSDFEVLGSLWMLRLLGLVRDAGPGRGLDVASLLASSAAPAPTAEDTVFRSVSSRRGKPEPPLASDTEPALTTQIFRSPAATATPAAPARREEPVTAAVAPAPMAPPVAPAVVADAAAAVAAARSLASVSVPGPDAFSTMCLELPQAAPAEPGGGDVSAHDLAAVGTSEGRVTRLAAEDLPQGTPSTSQSREEQAAEWFRSGERFLRQVDIHSAITSFREAVRLHPENAAYLTRLGTTLAKNPKWRKEAEESLSKAAEIVPWDGKIQHALGRLYAEAGLHRRAEARLKAAIEADPANAAARKDLKEVMEKLGKSGDGSGKGLLSRLSLRRKEEAPPADDGDLAKVGGDGDAIVV